MALDIEGPFFNPPEDFLLALLRPLEDEIPGLTVSSIIADDLKVPYLLCRSDTGAWDGDNNTAGRDRRFMRRFTADIQTWLEGPDADQRSAWLQEIVYLYLRTAWSRQVIVPGMGHISHLGVSTYAHEVPDWATSTGVNQYAQLPKGTMRYQAKYRVYVRPDWGNPPDLSDIVSQIVNP